METIRLVDPQNNEDKKSSYLSGNSGSVLNYVLKFQSQLCSETLIETYEECIQSILSISGVRYRYPLLGITHSVGMTVNTRCNLQLKTDDEFWGDITIYSNTAIPDDKMKSIELISSLLVHPLRSVIHQKANSLLTYNEETIGVCNSALVEQLVTREAKLSNREKVPMSMILFDIDRFQRISESSSFITRDEILFSIMKVMRSNIRDTDLLFRYSEDTYCLILKGVTPKDAHAISERIRNSVDCFEFRIDGKKPMHITISGGIAELQSTDSIETIFSRASNAVQHAKRTGRNQSIIADGKFIC